jgi:diketogulonate reductase-like aldo/keto reductase
MGERGGDHNAEEAALRLGLDLGMCLIDTAEMYADGGSELVVGRAIAGRRDEVFLVSKLYPQNASHAGTRAACERSLRRLGTDRLDMYLLHWRGAVPLAETVVAFEALRAEGKILRWGISNFDFDDMEELLALPAGGLCATNQVLYNPEYRGIEFDLLPSCAARRIPVMAYSPVGQGGRLLQHAVLRKIAGAHGATPAQVALAWAMRHPHVIAIPKATQPAHVRANAGAAAMTLTADDLTALDAAFPPPKKRRALDML